MQISTKALAQALKTAALVIERRNTIPILSHVMINTHTADGCLITGTDLDRQLAITIPTLDGSPLRAAFDNPLALAAVIKAGGADTVEIETFEQSVPADRGVDKPRTTHKAKITCGQMTGTVGTRDADDFPALAVSDLHMLDVELGGDAMDLLFRVAGAMSTEQTRYYLNGIYFHHVADWTWRFAATDGHRLYYANVELPNAKHGAEAPAGVIIPRETIYLLKTLRGTMGDAALRMRLTTAHRSNAPLPNLALDSGKPAAVPTVARFNLKSHGYEVELATKLIDGTFPEYQRVVPTESAHDMQVVFKRADLARALDGITSGMSEKTRAVSLTFDPAGKLIVAAKWIDQGFDGQIAIDATAKVNEPFSIGYNGRYLRALIDAVRGEELAIRVCDSASPGRIVDPAASDFLAVLMPMRL